MDTPQTKKRTRRDYYLFASFLVGLGSMDGAWQHRALKCVFGINKPFRIRLKDSWHHAGAVLINSGVPHQISDDRDWQLAVWIDPDSILGSLLERRHLHGNPGRVFPPANRPVAGIVRQTAHTSPESIQMLELVEWLLRFHLDAVPVPAVWDASINRVLRCLRQDPGGVSLRELERESGMSATELAQDFLRVTGIRLEQFMLLNRLEHYWWCRQHGIRSEIALEASNLSGIASLKSLFEEDYGLNWEDWEHERPYARVFLALDAPLALYT